MKNKRGFTLVELIAVITVITLLFMIATPKLMENYKDKKNKLYEGTIKELERLASLYLTDNPDIYSDISENGYVNISISTLCDEEYLTCPVKNPKDNSNIDGYINVIYENDEYVYRFVNEGIINENVLLESIFKWGNFK